MIFPKTIFIESILILAFFLLFSLFILGCQPTSELPNQDPDRRWGESSNGIRCSIAIETTQWPNGDPAILSVMVENVSEDNIELTTIPAFTLNEMQYWCPVNITENDHSLPANARSIISLKKDDQINSTIDASKLEWDQGISSIWPSKKLYSIVPVGRYGLRLDIEILNSNKQQWVRSNKVSVVISEKDF